MTLRLPNSDSALISPEKLKDYLLSCSHPVGKFKSVFFRSLGYTADRWEKLEDDIRAILGNEAVLSEQTDYGQKYEVRGNLTGPAGKTGAIVTVWIVLKGEEIPRFVTAYPGD